MKRVITWEEFRIDPTTYRFQGGEYGGTPISFFLVSTLPGGGPACTSTRTKRYS